MAEILPFRGTRYNPDRVKDLSKVVAPPYDVISSEEQDLLYNSHPWNIVRVVFGKDFSYDNDRENKYTRAAKFLNEWQKQGILKKDNEPSIYVYSQKFMFDGRPKERLGFIALLKLEEFDTTTSSIYPHENTLEAPKLDRTRLLHSIKANLGPIFALFNDEDKIVNTILERQTLSPPIVDIIDFQGIRNKLWKISDRDILLNVVRQLKQKKLFIADGHHRYEVALEFSKLKNQPQFGYILTYFTDLNGDGIVILPVHRLIAGVNKEGLNWLHNELPRFFSIEDIHSQDHIKSFLSGAPQGQKRFVMYSQNRFLGLKLNGYNNTLDVVAVHNLILEPIQRKMDRAGGKISIDFTKDLDYAIREVEGGRFSLSVIMNPTKVTELRDIASSGKRMPQKSTYFYPKVLTGLVINTF